MSRQLLAVAVKGQAPIRSEPVHNSQLIMKLGLTPEAGRSEYLRVRGSSGTGTAAQGLTRWSSSSPRSRTDSRCSVAVRSSVMSESENWRGGGGGGGGGAPGPVLSKNTQDNFFSQFVICK